MDVTLTPQQVEWQMKARKFAQEEVRPISLARDGVIDALGAFDWDVVKKGSRLGFRTAALSKEWGGHGIDFVSQALVIAEIAKGDSAIAKTFSQCWKWSHMMSVVCSPEQNERFLRRFVEDETCLLGHAGTEPNAGSDHRIPPEDDPRAGWKLKAERKGDEWILNGEKTFIANGSVASLFFVTARTDPNVSQVDGTTEFLVPLDTPGVRIGKVFNKSGWRFYQNAELIFDNARVPHANLVGEINKGFNLRSGTSQPFGDFELSANALGVCDAAVEMAMEYVRAVAPGGRYMHDNQTIQLQLAEMHMRTEALRAFVLRVAGESNAAKVRQHSINNILLMNFATETVQRVTRLNVDVHAGTGADAMPAGVDKLARDATIWTHLAGDSVQRMKGIRRLKF